MTVEFDRPIVHYPKGTRDGISSFWQFLFRRDESKRGGAGDWTTDGDIVNDSGQSRVSVSRDGVTYYTLNPALAPTVNYLYPTDASGNFQLPVDPELAPSDFAGLTLAGVAGLYGGAAGGASYAMGWAQDSNGNGVELYDIRYVRVDVLSGRAQVAGFAAVTNTSGQRVLAEESNNASHKFEIVSMCVFGTTFNQLQMLSQSIVRTIRISNIGKTIRDRLKQVCSMLAWYI